MSRIIIDKDEVSKDSGYRNFISFVFIEYFGENDLTLKECSEILGISSSKFRSFLIDKGYTPKQGGNPDPIGRKRSVNIFKIVKEKTKFVFPWCAFYYYYNRIGLTTYELAIFFGISQSLVIKYMKEYEIERNK
jgi:hypothetical protein